MNDCNIINFKQIFVNFFQMQEGLLFMNTE